MLYTSYSLLSKKTISRYNRIYVKWSMFKIDLKASINKYHFLVITKWQFGELNESYKSGEKLRNPKTCKKNQVSTIPFPWYVWPAQMESENEVGDVTEEDDPKPFRQCWKDDFGLVTVSHIHCCLSKKQKKTQIQISIKHMLNFLLVKVDQ